MNPVAHLVTAVAKLIRELALKLAISYWAIVVRAATICGALLAAASGIAAIGYVADIGLLVSVGVLVAGVVIAAWILVLMPALILIIEADEHVAAISKVITAALFVLFSTLVVSVFVYASGIWQYPKVFAPLAFAFSAFMVIGALGGNTSRQQLTARARTGIIALAVLIAGSALLPGRVVSTMRDWNRTVQTATPRLISYSPDMRFFDERDGHPVVWYGRNLDGQIDLFDNPGHHPSTGEALEPISRDVIKSLRQGSATKEVNIPAPPAIPTAPSIPVQPPSERPSTPAAPRPERVEPIDATAPALLSQAQPDLVQNPGSAPGPESTPISEVRTGKATTTTALATDASHVGDRIGARLVEPLKIGDRVLPTGCLVELEVRSFKAETKDAPPYIEVVPVSASYAGVRYPVEGPPIHIGPERRKRNTFFKALFPVPTCVDE